LEDHPSVSEDSGTSQMDRRLLKVTSEINKQPMATPSKDRNTCSSSSRRKQNASQKMANFLSRGCIEA
nr:hypothetical protein [Tanacetum cinerariifolium]